MKFVRIFENTDIDFTGHVLVQNDRTGSLDKMYIYIDFHLFKCKGNSFRALA